MVGIGRELTPTEIEAYDVVSADLARTVRVVSIPFLPGSFVGITLGRFIALTCETPEDGKSALLAHELVHVEQWERHGKVRFAASYITTFASGFVRCRSWKRAYLMIPAEVEARSTATEWQRTRA